jgi:hypothetical protein
MSETIERLRAAVASRYTIERELGQHFLMFESDPASAPELRIIRNWVAELDATLGRR